MIVATINNTQEWAIALVVLAAVLAAMTAIATTILAAIGWLFQRFIKHSDLQHRDNLRHQEEQDKSINKLNETLAELVGYMRGKKETE